MNALVVFSALVAVASAQYALPYAGYTGYNGYPYAGYGYGYSALPYNGLYNNYAGYSTALPYAGYGTALPYAAPYSYASTYHSQDELGQAAYGHQQADQAHNAVRDAFGNVAGSYSYVSPEGKPITVRYTAGANGFQVESNALPVAPVDTGVAPVAPVYTGAAPAPVDFTPEVKAATAEHLAAVEEAKNRSKRSALLPFAYSAAHPFTYSAGHPFAYSAFSAHPFAYNALPATTYAAEAGYPAELTETILNPGHATAYRVDPIA